MIVVNTSFRRAPWADVLYACDKPWWKEYVAEVDATFGAGERWSTSVRASGDYRLHHVASKQEGKPWGDNSISRGLNSGHQALSLAVMFGARRVILLGYDFQRTGGQSHWHGDHPRGSDPVPLGNLGRVERWVDQMGYLAIDLRQKGVKVMNATRDTALRCFPRVDLEEALA